MVDRLRLIIILLCSTLSIYGQGAADSAIVYSKTLDDINVLQTRGAMLEQQGNRMMVDLRQIDQMPRFMGVNDPLRYIQSLPGVETNNETQAGIHIQGCDNYQNYIAINGAPIIYPCHLLGLFSTMIAPHFSTMVVEQSAHRADMPSRIGGLVDMQTSQLIPATARVEGTIGLIASDITADVPIAKRHSIVASARTSYLNLLYGKWLRMQDLKIGYHFMDFNLTWNYQPTEKDRITVSGFYSRDKLSVHETHNNDIGMAWQNLTASAVWTHRGTGWNMRHQVSFSGFTNRLNMTLFVGTGHTDSQLGELSYKARFDIPLSEPLSLRTGLDYTHYMIMPLELMVHMDGTNLDKPSRITHSNEGAIYADLQYEPLPWLHTSFGLRGQIYGASGRLFGAVDPRFTLEFIPSAHHHLYLHAGCYHQYVHKAGLTGGGLPTDFFFQADTAFLPETAHTASLRYQCDLAHGEWVLSAEGYFKQLFHVTESKSDIYSLINSNFEYNKGLMTGDGRNYGLNVMVQRTRGILTGYVSYSLGWAKRKFPSLDGRTDYAYAASHERRHDLKVVLNSRFCKRWSVGGMFVLASGIPCTRAEEIYLINGELICSYSTYNGYHLPLYHRLDLTASCDIINKNNHLLGINVSVYNVYNQKNAQFMVYRNNLRPDYGQSLSFIMPSVSIYARW